MARASADVTGLAHAARGMLTQQDASVIMSLRDVTVPALVLVGADDTNFLAAADYLGYQRWLRRRSLGPYAVDDDEPGPRR